jgi:CBS domain-containing protein
MTTEVRCIASTTAVRDAVQLMLDKGVLGLPVEDAAGKIVGVFSMTDALWAAQHEDDSEAENSFYDAGALLRLIRAKEPVDRDELPVGSLMNKKVVALAPSASLQEAAALMATRAIHRVLVLDDKHKLVGIVTTLDVCRHVSS